MITGRVLVTGGAGYLGRSILRRIERDGWNTEVTIYSRDEHKQDEVRKRWPRVRRILGDVQNFDRLHAVLREHRYDLIIHAGAMKFIPESEANIFECIDNNVGGSRAVAMAAIAGGVKTVVGLSTDKAAAPLNTYGMTKALMERMYGEANRHSPTRFVCVRYGNVVSSSGSVVPLFREQAATLGRVRLTDPAMTRFWLTMDDAIDLIDTAAANASALPGGVFVPMCGAMSVELLARVAVGGDVPIDIVGLRPGEKLHETLVLDSEAPRTKWIASPASVYDVCVIKPYGTPDDGTESIRRGYSSDEPRHWISAHTMAEWIEDAATI